MGTLKNHRTCQPPKKPINRTQKPFNPNLDLPDVFGEEGGEEISHFRGGDVRYPLRLDSLFDPGVHGPGKYEHLGTFIHGVWGLEMGKFWGYKIRIVHIVTGRRVRVTFEMRPAYLARGALGHVMSRLV